MIDFILTMLEENSTNTILFMTLAIIGLILSAYIIVTAIIDLIQYLRSKQDDEMTF